VSVRKRSWNTAKGVQKEAWIVDYVDQADKRRIKTFSKKKQADAYAATVTVEVRQGLHTPDSQSITIAEAGERWIRSGEANQLERATLDEYRRHLKMHINPYVGNVKLSKLTAPMVMDLRNKLREGAAAPGEETGTKRSPAMVKKIISSLSSIVADAQEAGLIAQNVVRGITGRKKRNKASQRRKLKVGVDIPTPEEIKAIIGKLEDPWRPLIVTAVFTGLRASELRGLRWSDVDLKKAEVHVHQRADRYNEIAAPKSEAGERTVPLPQTVANILREWKLVCPKADTGRTDRNGAAIKELRYVFPNGAGRVENHGNIINRGFVPAQIAAGVADAVMGEGGRPKLDPEGRPLVEARYTGLHALRHFYASWCINREEDGGLGLPGKVVQERLGHSSIVMTMDVYGHLFKGGNDGAALAKAAEKLLA
jgi:integrase